MRISDWSSDVCSSDLARYLFSASFAHLWGYCPRLDVFPPKLLPDHINVHVDRESETIPFKDRRSEEHTSELQSLMRISYAVFCLKKKTPTTITQKTILHKPYIP